MQHYGMNENLSPVFTINSLKQDLLPFFKWFSMHSFVSWVNVHCRQMKTGRDEVSFELGPMPPGGHTHLLQVHSSLCHWEQGMRAKVWRLEHLQPAQRDTSRGNTAVRVTDASNLSNHVVAAAHTLHTFTPEVSVILTLWLAGWSEKIL